MAMALWKRQLSTPAEKSRAEKAMERFFDWDYDIYESARRRSRVAWIVAALSTTLAVVAVAAVAALAPLKSIEAVFVRVDNATGAVDVLYRIDEETQISKRDLLDKGYLARYVREREGYFYPIADHQYRRVVRMSIGQAREQYRQGFNQKNENAPINIYKDHARVDISLKSISFIEKGVAQVRFIATVIDADSEERHHRIATVHYDYEPAATIPLSVLADNALGFAVSEYRSEPEDAG